MSFLFSARFLKKLPVETIIDEQAMFAIYNETPLYYIPGQEEDIGFQLREFTNSAIYEPFKAQCSFLLQSIENWCITHQVPIRKYHATELPQILYSSFELFKARLFGQEDYFSLRAAILYSDGKKALEELFILLQDDSIPFYGKKNILMNLQEGMVVCADGSLTNILDAKDDLRAAIGLDATIESIKRTLLRQFAVSFIAPYNIRAGNEIHVINRLYNHVADSYGVPKREDKFVFPIPPERLVQFAAKVKTKLSPLVVFRLLVTRILDDFTNIQEQLFQKEVRIAWSSDLNVHVEKLITEFNKRYTPLFQLDYNSILNFDMDTETLTPQQLKEIEVQVVVVKKFRELFLEKNSSEYESPLFKSECASLHHQHPMVWIERDSKIEVCSPATFFNEYLPPFRTISWNTPLTKKQADILIGLWELYPAKHQEIIARLITSKVWLTYLFEGNNLSLIKSLLQNNLRPAQGFNIHLNLIPEIDQALREQLFSCGGLIDMSYLMQVNKMEYLERLIEHNWITKASFNHTKREVIFASLYAQPGYTIIEKLFRKGIVTLLSIAEDKQEHLIAHLLAKGLITKENLAQVHEAGSNIGKNTVWFLALDGQVALIQQLLEANLLSTNHLITKARGGDQGYSALTLLSLIPEASLLISSLFQAGLITIKQLAARKEFSVLHRAIEQGLVTVTDLDDSKLRKVSLWIFLIESRRFASLELLVMQGLIIPAQLTMPTSSGENLLQILVDEARFDFFRELVSYGLLRAENIFAMGEAGRKLIVALNQNQPELLEILQVPLLQTELAGDEISESCLELEEHRGQKRKNVNAGIYGLSPEEALVAQKRNRHVFFDTSGKPIDARPSAAVIENPALPRSRA